MLTLRQTLLGLFLNWHQDSGSACIDPALWSRQRGLW